MQFVSTRGGVQPCTLRDAVFTGFSEDGGLLFPATSSLSPAAFSAQQFLALSELSFPEVCSAVLAAFGCGEEALRSVREGMRGAFLHPDACPLLPLSRAPSMHFAQLYWGPTAAFKDLALQGLCAMLNGELGMQRSTIIVSTSGDTGPAAIAATDSGKSEEQLRENGGLQIIVMYPRERVTVEQERQMLRGRALRAAAGSGTSGAPEGGVRVLASYCTSDENDEALRAVFANMSAEERAHITSVNSINIGRIALSVAHYFYLAARLHRGASELTPVDFYVPTGALGNGCSGVLARLMGCPIGDLHLCVNANDVLKRFAETGIYEPGPETIDTIASAMDAKHPYNFERLLFVVCDGDTTKVQHYLRQLEETGRMDLRNERWRELGLKAHSSSDEQIVESMRRTWREYKMVVDPHTACAMHAVAQQVEPSSRERFHVVLSTAHAAKFSAVVRDALGFSPDRHPGVESGDDVTRERNTEMLRSGETCATEVPGKGDWRAVEQQLRKWLDEDNCKP